MRVIPILDLKAGQAVRAVAGDRVHYEPLRSILHVGSDPIGLVRDLRDRFGVPAPCMADLDAVARARPTLGCPAA